MSAQDQTQGAVSRRRALAALAALMLCGAGCEHERREPPPDPGDAMPEAGLDAGERPDPGLTDAAADAADAEVTADALVEGGEPVYRLTLLHIGGGGGHMIPRGEAPGVARMVTALRGLRARNPPGPNQGLILLSTGDTLVPGPALDLAFESGPPSFQGRALAALGVDAAAIGDRDLGQGPEPFADLVESAAPIPFVAANLSFLSEPTLAAHVSAGRLVTSAVLEAGGDRIGVVGAVMRDFASHTAQSAVQQLGAQDQINEELASLRGQGVNKLIVLAHMDSLPALLELASQLEGADVLVGSTGDSVLAGEGAPVHTGDVPVGPYPVRVRDAAGRIVRVVGTPDDLRYVGRLTLDFDIRGVIVATDSDSGLTPVGTRGSTAVAQDPATLAELVAPAQAALEGLGAQPVGLSAVPLDARRGLVRVQETNLGDLGADALRWVGAARAADEGSPEPAVALLPARVFRGDALVPPGPLSKADLWAWLAHDPYVVLAEGVSPDTLKVLLEDALAGVDAADGRLLQISGATVVWDPQAAPRTLGPDGEVQQAGRRVRRVLLDDGTQMVEAGLVRVSEAISVALTDDLARRHGLSGRFVHTGISVGRALRGWIAGGLEGRVERRRYPERGLGRLQTTGGGQ